MRDPFILFEYFLFLTAFVSSVIIGYKEGFKRKNIILISLLLFVIGINSLDAFPVLNTEFIKANKFSIRNMSMLFEIAAYLLLYESLLKRRRYKSFLILYLLSFILLALYFSLGIQPINSVYPTYSFVFGSIGVLVGILLFFYEKLNDAQSESIFKNFWFWLSTGLFVFLATEIPLMSLLNYLLQSENVDINQVVPIMSVKRVISSFYYLMYLVGVLCRMRT